MVRLSTGISGLDSLIEGGIPIGSVTMLSGNPGTGKTISSSHFIYAGLTSTIDDKDNGVYISFSESKLQFYQNSHRLGMDFEKYETQNRFMFLDFVSLTKDGIQDVLEEILSAIRITKAKRVVLDSFTALSLAFSDRMEARIAIHVFLGKLMRAEGITSILVIEIPYGEERIGVGVEESIVDGIIRLGHGEDNASPFYIKILKMRGTKIDKEKHICNIINGTGMILYRKQNLSQTYPISVERIPTGIIGFDERIDNGQSAISKGLIKGTLTAIVGSTGSAKSTFAFQFVASGVKEYNDSSIFCSLEDSVNEIKRVGTGYGYDISDLEKKGLSIISLDPDEENPDNFIAKLEAEIVRTKAKRLVIDGLSSFAFKYKKDIHIITRRISSVIHKYQVTTLVTILVTQKYGLEVTSLNLSAIFQNIVLLRIIEVNGHMKRILTILKITSTQQDQSILEFKITTKKGIEIVGPVGDIYEGIFTNVVRIKE